MAARIEVGRLDERRTGTGVERQAHGEFVGTYGELASYAIGWTTDHPTGDAVDHGRVTIGLGAGNEGGGTFHARVLDHGQDWAYALADEPFAEPVLLVVHDLEDDDGRLPAWQLIGTTGAADEGAIGHLSHALERDPTLAETLDLEPGRRAWRDHPGGPWTRD